MRSDKDRFTSCHASQHDVGKAKDKERRRNRDRDLSIFRRISTSRKAEVEHAEHHRKVQHRTQ